MNCPLCHEGAATVRISVGLLGVAICTRCVASGFHLMKLLGKALGG